MMVTIFITQKDNFQTETNCLEKKNLGHNESLCSFLWPRYDLTRKYSDFFRQLKTVMGQKSLSPMANFLKLYDP